MQPFTIRAILRTDKENKKGLCPISICVTINRKRTYHSTGKSIEEKSWDSAKERVRPNVENAASINTRITTELGRIEKDLFEADQKGRLTSETGKAAARPQTDFFQFAEAIFKDMDAKGQGTTARRYRNNIPSIKAYHTSSLNLNQIDKAWLKGYEQFCRGTYMNERRKDEKAVKQNTIWSRFKMLRKVLLAAQADELIAECPIGEKRDGYPMPTWEKVPKDYLTYDEVLALFKKLGHAGFTEVEDMTLAYFLVECTAGIRHSDWSRFTIEKLKEGNSLKVRTKKTGAPVYVPITTGGLLDKAIKHIKKKQYQYTATETALANKLLKHIVKVAGISKPVTTHTARHTCATLLLEKGFSRETVAEVLGVSMKVIDVYAKMTRIKVKQEFERLGGL